MRKTKQVTVMGGQGNRDTGKVFLITEMPASQTERWALRALTALAKSNPDLPEDITEMPPAALAVMGFEALSKISYADVEPLLDEMMTCVQVIPDPSNPMLARPWKEEDIEEVSTRLILRREVFSLHTDFLQLAAPSTSTSGKRKAAGAATRTSA
jgi:hypothetical protein